jgi:hypothetical protein
MLRRHLRKEGVAVQDRNPRKSLAHRAGSAQTKKQCATGFITTPASVALLRQLLVFEKKTYFAAFTGKPEQLSYKTSDFDRLRCRSPPEANGYGGTIFSFSVL